MPNFLDYIKEECVVVSTMQQFYEKKKIFFCKMYINYLLNVMFSNLWKQIEKYLFFNSTLELGRSYKIVIVY